jgi:hypothetical protein
MSISSNKKQKKISKKKYKKKMGKKWDPLNDALIPELYINVRHRTSSFLVISRHKHFLANRHYNFIYRVSQKS